MKTLELFGGSCSFSRVAEKRGHEIYTTDNETFDSLWDKVVKL